MSVIVQKFGGTSVGSVERIQEVAKKIKQEVCLGHQVVVVVSAIGSSTDSLVEMAAQITSRPNSREMDILLSTGEQVSIALLTMALQELQINSVSMTGWQAGILTEEIHGNARIIEINTEHIVSKINEGKVVVVAGFQGISKQGQITTLGRGGSDTTAVALAAALSAERCDIFTDVRGVYTADPRIVPLARQIKQISYEEMIELSCLGAKVLHSRAVTWAKNFHVSLSVKSAFEDAEGTWIREHTIMEEDLIIHGVTFDIYEKNVAKVSIVGAQLLSYPEVSITMVRSLLEAQVVVKEMLASPMNVSCLIPLDQVKIALQTLHCKFRLDQEKEIVAI
jgi:aspartate kinase